MISFHHLRLSLLNNDTKQTKALTKYTSTRDLRIDKEIGGDRNFSLVCLEIDTTMHNMYTGVHSHVVNSESNGHSAALKHNWGLPLRLSSMTIKKRKKKLSLFFKAHNVFITSRAFVAMHSNECLLKTCFK